jgi:aminoglycoside phosphotransferase (APT) family kinase protein
VLGLVRGLLPVPEVLEVRRPDGTSGTPGLLVTSFLPGERLDLLLPDLDADRRRAVGAELGAMLGRMVQMPLPRAGRFVDGDLRIEPWTGLGDLAGWVQRQRDTTALAEWPEPAYQGLLEVAESAQAQLDEVARVCLVHSDVNPKNLLVDGRTGKVTGLLDWEFAHAGLPGTDLGNLLRFDREPVFAEAVIDGYLRVAGHVDGLDSPGGRQRLLDRARAADLLALWTWPDGVERTRSPIGPTPICTRSQRPATCTPGRRSRQAARITQSWKEISSRLGRGGGAPGWPGARDR